MIDNRLNSETAAKLWQAVANFLEKSGCNDETHRNSYILYMYASGITIKKISEAHGLTTSRIRKIIEDEVDRMTNGARMLGYFTLQEKYNQLQEKYDELQQKYELLINVAKKNIPEFITVDDFTKRIFCTPIERTNMPTSLKNKLKGVGCEYVWQLAAKNKKSLTEGRKLSKRDVDKISDFLHSNGVDFDTEIPMYIKRNYR